MICWMTQLLYIGTFEKVIKNLDCRSCFRPKDIKFKSKKNYLFSSKHFFFFFSDKIIYDSETSKAEASQEALLKMIDENHVIADHSFDHMSHNSENSPKFAYRNVEEDVVSKMIYLLDLFCLSGHHSEGRDVGIPLRILPHVCELNNGVYFPRLV